MQLHKVSFEDLILWVRDLTPWIAILVLLAVLAVLTIKQIRAKTLQHELTLSELMSKFRDLHSRGELTDAEYRTIKTTLATQLQEQLKDNGDTG
jgi:uncharacterized membrane protein